MIPASSKTYYLARLSVLLITAALVVGMVACDSGAQSPSQNLEIRTWYDLDAIRNNLSGNHTLMNDLDSTAAGYEELASPTANQGKGWDQIGAFYTAPFIGTFDGQGHEIRDLFINRPREGNPVGLFSFVGEAGVIQNVGVVNASVTSEGEVGALIGENDGTVSNSYSTGNVTGDFEVGGLVGLNYGTIRSSYSSSDVTGDEQYVGGLVGLNGAVEHMVGTLSNSYSIGSVSGNKVVGGLVGLNTGTVANSYSTGSVSGNSSAGGLVGLNEDVVSNSFWDIQSSGQAASDGGIGKTGAEMKSIATFSGAAWGMIAVADSDTRDTGYIWNIVDGETYPFLSWQP